jgi:uncharacterized protein
VKVSKPRGGYSRAILLAVALLLPAVSLIPLGSLWLWEHGYVIHWALGTCLAVTGVYYLQRRLLVPLAVVRQIAGDDPGSAAWSPRQAQAWDDIQRLAAGLDPERMGSRDGALEVAHEAISTVARRMHPERGDPLLQFTVPEALAVIERASASLRKLVVGSLPLGDRVTVAQIMWLYRWRGAAALVEKGYELWRILRLLNPAAAVTQELRERFSRQLYEVGRKHVTQRLTQAYVSEIGRAAIDLYGGNLRVGDTELSAHVTSASNRDLETIDQRQAEPIRILVAGQTSAGKSSLVNALASEIAAAVDVLPTTSQFSAYRLRHDDLPAALVIDSPGLGESGDFDALIEATSTSDMVLWVLSAARAARDIDSRALAAIRAYFAASAHRSRPPMLLVLTHIDHLRPFGEWAPPYDVAAGTNGKARSIREAMQAAGQELGFSAGDILPVRIDGAVALYNVDTLWARILALMPDAQRARMLRTLSDVRGAVSWRTVWSQAAGAGRVIKDTFLSRSETP